MSKAVTLSDIAKACDTSIVTVSKALADKKGVSSELKLKIKQTADRLGYVAPKPQQTSKNDNIVGVVIPEKFMNPNGSFYWALYNDLVKLFGQNGYFCLIDILSEEDEQSLTMPKMVTDGTVSGLVSLGQLSREYVVALKRNMPKMILLDYYIHGLDFDSVTSDGYGGGYALTSYLIERGHKKIGFIGTVKATSSIFDRYMGYMKAMIDHDLKVNDEWTLDDRDKRDFINVPLPEKLPTAFVCNCDEAAFHTIKQLEENGIKVPEDISVVGYDNYLISEVSNPPITTIDVDSHRMADKAVKLLISRMEDPLRDASSINITGSLIEKGSVKDIGIAALSE
ncbi:MAG: LacI family DNA-binding transcriptional regulator [Ruminococcus sp.]|nr:LacI family DNA-binding transcriptional regulator [Ruminococcus sp.]